MNNLQKARRTLGVESSDGKEAIERRYKRLAKAWHPDHYQSAESKADAEEEMKKINEAREVLINHLNRGEHRQQGCECQEPSGEQFSRDSEEDLARKRDQERTRAREPKEGQTIFTGTNNSGSTLKESADERRFRLAIAGAEVVIFFAITFLGLAGYSVKTFWNAYTHGHQASYTTERSTLGETSPPIF